MPRAPARSSPRRRSPLSPDDAAEVVERTEGWPVGLFLAAAIARDGGDDALAVSGDDRYVADYLYRESLAKLPEHQQRFLRRTAVLDTFSATLCDAVLDSVDAQDVLRELEASDVFLVPLDRRREWFRYHALFREFLLGELRRVEPDAIVDLHLAAAAWFEEHGSPAMAIEHLLDNSTERTRATRLVASVALATYQSGHLTTVQRWFAALGAPAIEAYPPLAVLAGWIAALTGQTYEADRWAAVLDSASYDLTPDDGSASFESARAMLRSIMCAAGPEQAMADAEFAIASEPTWSPWRDQALALLGEAKLLAGEVDEAEAAFTECSATADARDNADVLVISESELAVLAMDHGRWVEAAEHVQAALAAIDRQRMHDYATAVLAFAAAARLAMHNGDLADVQRQVTRAMRARPTCTYAIPFIAVRVRLQLAKVFWALTDHATARHLSARDRRHPAAPARARRPCRRGVRLPRASCRRASNPGRPGAHRSRPPNCASSPTCRRIYVDPPAHAVVLSIDEKGQIQALDRTQPGLPLKSGRAGTMTHDYKRHGTTTLFAALNVLDGTVIGRNMKHHRHQEFIRFLNPVDAQVPKRKAIHAIVDNYATHKHPKVREWLTRHPRWTFHFTPDFGLLAQCRRRLLRQAHQDGASSVACSDPSTNSRPPSTASS